MVAPGVRGSSRFVFFDNDLVMRIVGRKTAKNLAKAGAFIRRRAQSSIRYGKKPSKPGKPPKNRTRKLKDGIEFSFDTQSETLVVGPKFFRRTGWRGDGDAINSTVPRVLEMSGDIRSVEIEVEPGKWFKCKPSLIRIHPQSRIRTRTVKVQARPFMLPAFEKEKVKSAKLWENCITGGGSGK